MLSDSVVPARARRAWNCPRETDECAFATHDCHSSHDMPWRPGLATWSVGGDFRLGERKTCGTLAYLPQCCCGGRGCCVAMQWQGQHSMLSRRYQGRAKPWLLCAKVRLVPSVHCVPGVGPSSNRCMWDSSCVRRRHMSHSTTAVPECAFYGSVRPAACYAPCRTGCGHEDHGKLGIACCRCVAGLV